MLLCHAGQYAEAEALLLRALDIRQRAFGSYHPEYAACLNNVAVLHREKGDYELAGRWYRKALSAHERIMNHLLIALPHRQQLLLLGQLRRTLDGYLSVLPHTEASAEEAYSHLLQWKGFAFASRWVVAAGRA